MDSNLNAEISRLKDEIARLRDALTSLLECSALNENDNEDSNPAIEAARAALRAD